MKKRKTQGMVCCLGLLLLAAASCSTATKAGVAKGPEEMPQAKEEKPVPLPNIAVHVMQVNNKEGLESTEETPAEAASTVKEQGGQAEEETNVAPVTLEAEPETRVARSKRVPATFKVYQYMPDTSKSLGTETLLSEISKEIAGKVFYELQGEGEKNFTAKVAVVNAVPLADFKRETEFGRVMAEYMLTDLADRGLKVTELRMGRDINILPQTGEFIMSRNIGELANNTPELDYVVVSTFSNTRKTLIFQGRLVSLKDGLVKTSWRYGLPLNRELLGLFHTVEQPFKIAVKGMQ